MYYVLHAAYYALRAVYYVLRGLTYAALRPRPSIKNAMLKERMTRANIWPNVTRSLTIRFIVMARTGASERSVVSSEQ